MQDTNRWSGGNPDKFTHAKKITKTVVKKFGPLLLTGLAAVAEHHWLKQDDAKEVEDDGDDKHSYQKLQDQVSKLRRSLKRKGKFREGDGESTSSSSYSTPPGRPPCRKSVDKLDPSYMQQQTREQYFEMDINQHRQPISTYYHTTPFVPEVPLPRRLESPDHPDLSRDYVDRSNQHFRHVSQRHRHHRRHVSAPRYYSSVDDISNEAIHASKIAAVTGLVEALHVGNIHGGWIGPKGVRVSTAMAASFGASYSRNQDRADYRRRDVVVDIGTGILVSQLVHGSSRQMEKSQRASRRKRRWSFCY
jgi:hypothetical protein